jgi:hypothetical protein
MSCAFVKEAEDKVEDVPDRAISRTCGRSPIHPGRTAGTGLVTDNALYRLHVTESPLLEPIFNVLPRRTIPSPMPNLRQRLTSRAYTTKRCTYSPAAAIRCQRRYSIAIFLPARARYERPSTSSSVSS